MILHAPQGPGAARADDEGVSASAVAAGVAGWLRANQQGDGRVLDPLHREHGTYADGFAAFVFREMAVRTADTAWEESHRRSLHVAARRPRTSEFDQLALLLAATTQLEGSATVRLPPLYRGNRLVSNNWVAMRALNHSLRARLSATKTDHREAQRLWTQVLGWQLPCGLFVDSPGGDATPVTYHAKFCAMLALALSETDAGTSELQESFRRGLEALCVLVSPSGVLVPYGRSRNTLFGYAAAVLSFRRGAALLGRPEFHETAERLTQRIACFQRPDGHIPCVLNEREREKHDWDVYVNNPDYNAYAAALLLLCGAGTFRAAPGAPHTRGHAPRPEGPAAELDVSRVGPLVVARHGSAYAAFAGHGQSVPLGTPFFCDHRYYGMQPLWIERDGVPLLEPEVYAWRGGADRSRLVDPEHNGWLPVVEDGGRRYTPRVYEQVEVSTAGGVLQVVGEGSSVAYAPVPRWRRAVGQVLYLVSGAPPPVFQAHPLPGARLLCRLTWSPGSRECRVEASPASALPPGAVLRQPRGRVGASPGGGSASLP